jgi:hypothetical protein
MLEDQAQEEMLQALAYQLELEQREFLEENQNDNTA